MPAPSTATSLASARSSAPKAERASRRYGGSATVSSPTKRKGEDLARAQDPHHHRLDPVWDPRARRLVAPHPPDRARNAADRVCPLRTPHARQRRGAALRASTRALVPATPAQRTGRRLRRGDAELAQPRSTSA